MKKAIFILALLLTTAIAVPAGAITVDGIFDTSSEWAGYYAADDGVGGNGYVGPGYGGQAFDVEYLGLKSFDTGAIYFGLQTGFDVANGVTYGGTYYGAGDFGLDVDNNGTFDYALRFSVSGSTAHYDLVEVTSWGSVMYSAHGIADPYRYSTGNLIASFDGAYSSGVFANNSDGGTSYVLEGSFDASLLSLTSLGPMTLHWTMQCGNDYLNVTTSPVPEPSTLLLAGMGLAGMLVRRKFRKKQD